MIGPQYPPTDPSKWRECIVHSETEPSFTNGCRTRAPNITTQEEKGPTKRLVFFIEQCQPMGYTVIIKNHMLNESQVNVAEAFVREETSVTGFLKRVRLPPRTVIVVPVNCDLTGLRGLRSNVRL